jgi:hypothetical protein
LTNSRKRKSVVISKNQKTFDDFSLLRVDEFKSTLDKISNEINSIKPEATIDEIRALSKELEKDLKKLRVNIPSLKKRYGILEMLQNQYTKNPNNAVISSAIEELERRYASKLVEIAIDQLSKYQ